MDLIHNLRKLQADEDNNLTNQKDKSIELGRKNHIIFDKTIGMLNNCKHDFKPHNFIKCTNDDL